MERGRTIALATSGFAGKSHNHEGIRQVRTRYCRFSCDRDRIVCEQFCSYGFRVDALCGSKPEGRRSRRRSHGRWRWIRHRLHFRSLWASDGSLQILATANTKPTRNQITIAIRRYTFCPQRPDFECYRDVSPISWKSLKLGQNKAGRKKMQRK
jgi:hypothetical protein